jgi:hypothetical protein
VFHFVNEDADPVTASMDEIVTRLSAFYNSTPAGATAGFSISDYIGIQVARTASNCRFVFYFSETIAPVTTPWGSPVRSTNWTIGAPVSATGYPGEVAAAISYHADLTDVPESSGDTRPAARKRGRIFLGPLTTAIGSNEGVNQDASITSSIRTNLGKSALALRDSNALTTWCVYSPTANTVYEVVGGYVDDAFDTQRRRGTKAEIRTVWA